MPASFPVQDQALQTSTTSAACPSHPSEFQRFLGADPGPGPRPGARRRCSGLTMHSSTTMAGVVATVTEDGPRRSDFLDSPLALSTQRCGCCKMLQAAPPRLWLLTLPFRSNGVQNINFRSHSEPFKVSC
jgi:hypothetical protein